eukprot:COSAG02_NODE_47524_length_340_cov_1.070539_1_plen_31_part_10
MAQAEEAGGAGAEEAEEDDQRHDWSGHSRLT